MNTAYSPIQSLRSPDFFRTVFDVSNDAIIIHDPMTGAVLDANQRFRELFGFTQEECQRINLSDISSGIGEYSYENILRRLQFAAEYGAQIFQWLAKHKLGKTFWVEVNFKRIEMDGHPRILSFIHDISDIKFADQSLRESEKKWRTLAQNVPDFIIMLNQHGTILFTNYLLPGYNQEDLIGSSIMGFISPEFHLPMRHCLQQVFDKNELVTFEHIATSEPGQWRYYNSRISPIKEDNDITSALMVSTDVTEQKLAQQALHKSEEKFSKAFYSSPDAIMIAQLSDGKIVECNESFYKITGYTKEEVKNHTTLELNLWNRPQQREEALDILKREQCVRDFQAEIQIKSGELRICLVSMEQIEIDNIPCIVSVSRDITQQKQAEDALRNIATGVSAATGAEFFRSLATMVADTFKLDYAFIGQLKQNEPNIIQTIAVRAKGQLVNNFDYKLDGTPCEKILNNNICAFPDSVQQRFPEDQLLLDMGVESYVGTPLVDSSGKTLGIFVVLHSTPITNFETIKSMLRIFAVRTSAEMERINAERALRRSEEHLRLAIRASGIATWEWDVVKDKLTWSDNAYSIFHIDPENEITSLQEYTNLVFTEDKLPLQRALKASLRSDTLYYIEHRIIWNNTETRWIAIQGEVYRNQNNKPVRMRGTVTDTTQRKKAEDELLQHREHLEELVAKRTDEITRVNKELEAFSYSVSHDLRAPLRSIDGFSQALLDDYSTVLDSTAKDYLDRVRNSAQKMSQLIDDLLKLSRLTRSQLKTEPINLGKIAEELISKLKNENPHHCCEFHIQPDLQAVGDEGLLRVVLDNLLNNARKYSSKTDHAVITLERVDSQDEDIFCVQDNGVGFSMDYSGKLFGAFQRLHHSNEFEGNGIGLATVARIIHRHGGRVWATGEVDKGASFYFSLPQR